MLEAMTEPAQRNDVGVPSQPQGGGGGARPRPQKPRTGGMRKPGGSRAALGPARQGAGQLGPPSFGQIPGLPQAPRPMQPMQMPQMPQMPQMQRSPMMPPMGMPGPAQPGPEQMPPQTGGPEPRPEGMGMGMGMRRPGGSVFGNPWGGFGG